MAKIGDVTFRGASGTDYAFVAYSTDTNFNDVSAVYAFTKRTIRDGRGSHSMLYIGETGELGTRIAGHEKWDCVRRYDCNCVCVHTVGTKQLREAAERDLLASNLNPPCQ